MVRDKVGGLNQCGQPLQAGDDLPYPPAAARVATAVPPAFIPDYGRQPLLVRCMPSTLWPREVEALLGQCFCLHPQSDRMGCRLQGTAIETVQTGIISQGVGMGTIQLLPSGEPIVLMRDGQTMGGYPVLGQVAYLDLAILAQARPNQPVQWVAASVAELEAEYCAYRDFFAIR